MTTDNLIIDTGCYPPVYTGFILHDVVGDYGLDKGDFPMCNRVTCIANSSEIRDHLEYAEVVRDDDHTEELTKKVVRKTLEIYKKPNHHVYLEEFVTTTDWVGDFYAITFWVETKEDLLKALTAFLDKLQGMVENAIEEESGGDDSFFDYVPSYVDTFRQACQYLGEHKRYNDFTKWVKKIDKEFYDEALYTSFLP